MRYKAYTQFSEVLMTYAPRGPKYTCRSQAGPESVLWPPYEERIKPVENARGDASTTHPVIPRVESDVSLMTDFIP